MTATELQSMHHSAAQDGRALNSLVYTSADDLRVQINYYKSLGALPKVSTLQAAHALCIQHGYKTKAKLLQSLLNKTAKEGAK